MADPKPISLTQTATNPSSEDPQPMIVVGGIPVTTAEFEAALEGVTGYNAAETQTLKNVTGTLTWVTDV